MGDNINGNNSQHQDTHEGTEEEKRREKKANGPNQEEKQIKINIDEMILG